MPAYKTFVSNVPFDYEELEELDVRRRDADSGSKRLQVWLPSSLYDRVRQVAGPKGITDFVVRALTNELDGPRKLETRTAKKNLPRPAKNPLS